jgi:hypothetical protein
MENQTLLDIKKESIMKCLKTSLIGIIVALILSGCIVSLHPLYTEEDIIFEPDLVGQWGDVEGGGEVLEFQKIWNKQYKLVYTDGDGKENRFLAVLLKVKNQMFLDWRPLAPREDLRPVPLEVDLKSLTEEELNQYRRPLDREENLNCVTDFYKDHLLPVHTFYHIKQITPTLKLRALNGDVFRRLMQENPEEIRYEEVFTSGRDAASDRKYAMTSQPKELQKFLFKHLNTQIKSASGNELENAFEDFATLKRISTENATETEEKALNTDADASSDSQSGSAVPE